jgi:hypothetical protein
VSAKVRILEIGQSVSDPGRKHVKKSIAALLVRRLLAEIVTPGVIRLLPVTTCHDPRTKFIRIAKPYIPEKMPPREVPGVFFQPPQSDQWKIEHRTVTFAL